MSHGYRNRPPARRPATPLGSGNIERCHRFHVAIVSEPRLASVAFRLGPTTVSGRHEPDTQRDDRHHRPDQES